MVVMPGDRLGLIDFDIASHGCRRKRNVPLNDLTTAYTVGYAPPEQIIGREAFPASDLYALATSVVYAATGKHPIHQWNARRGRITVPRGFGAGLTRLLTWMLEPSLDDRCPTAKAAMAELKHLRLA
jgi:serine/threonine-protein kinase